LLYGTMRLEFHWDFMLFFQWDLEHHRCLIILALELDLFFWQR